VLPLSSLAGGHQRAIIAVVVTRQGDPGFQYIIRRRYVVDLDLERVMDDLTPGADIFEYTRNGHDWFRMDRSTEPATPLLRFEFWCYEKAVAIKNKSLAK
jgi:hypothetical protein